MQMNGCMQNSTKEEVQVKGRFIRRVRVFVCGGFGPQRNGVSCRLVRNAIGVRVQEAETKSVDNENGMNETK